MESRATYAFRTFLTNVEATNARQFLFLTYPGPIRIAYSDFVEKWVLYCPPEDAKALYYRLQASRFHA